MKAISRRLLWLVGPVECSLLALASLALRTDSGPAVAIGLSFLMLFLAWVAARGLTRWLMPDPPDAVASLTTLLVFYSLVVWSQLATSHAGLFDQAGQWWFWSIAAGAGVVLGSLRGPERSARLALSKSQLRSSAIVRMAMVLVIATACLPTLIAVSHRWMRPTVEWDAMAYHLYFPVQWIHQGKIGYVFKPFGPEYFTYFPSNFECWATWLYWPSMTDWLAKTSGALATIWIAVALWAWTRLLGGDRLASTVAVVLWLTSPICYQSGVGAMNDLTAAACFLTSLVFLEAAASSHPRQFLALSGLAAGQFVGTKFTTLLYTPLLLGMLVCVLARLSMESDTAERTARRRGQRFRLALWWIAFAMMGGGYWYAHNWIATGNPLYPLRVTVSGMSLLKGPLTSAAMREGGWLHPDRSLSALLTLVDNYLGVRFGSSALAPGGLSIGLANLLLVIGALTIVVSTFGRSGWSRAKIATLSFPIVGSLLFWFLNPHTREIRLAAPVLILLFVWPSALLSSLSGWPRRALLLVLSVLLAILLLRSGIAVSRLCWSEGGFTWPAVWGGVALVAAAALALFHGAESNARWFSGLAVAGVLSIAIHTDLGPAWASDVMNVREQRARFFAQASVAGAPFDRSMAQAWAAMDALTQAKPATIAYVGHNHPYMLFGPTLQNRVVYVSPNRQAHDLLHEYAQELDPSAIEQWRVRDRLPIYRKDLDRNAWRERLRQGGVDFLLVTTVHPGETHAFAREMDEQGYSVERRWSQELEFPVVAEGEGFAIYRVNSL